MGRRGRSTAPSFAFEDADAAFAHMRANAHFGKTSDVRPDEDYPSLRARMQFQSRPGLLRRCAPRRMEDFATAIAITDDYQNVALSLADWKSIPGRLDHSFDKPFLNRKDTVAKLAPFDVLCTMRERMELRQESLLARLPKLKLICITGGITACSTRPPTKRGIVVSHTSSGNSVATTVEICFALMLAAARNLTREDRAMRNGQQTELGMSLEGRTLASSASAASAGASRDWRRLSA